MDKIILETRGLAKRYKMFRLGPVDISLPGGCITGLIGENGAGKTTFMKTVLGITPADDGSVRIFGTDMAREDAARGVKELLGVAFGDKCFPMTFKASEMGRILRGIYGAWDQAAFAGYLEKFHLDPKKPVKDYSQGMRVKLNLAAAMSHGARFLILDEPASGLDPVAREELLDILRDFVEDEDHGVLISSHITSDLEKISDWVAFLHRGDLKLFQEKDRLLEEYAVLKTTDRELSFLKPEDVIGVRRGGFGDEALVRRRALPAGAVWEAPSLEDIFIYYVRGDES